MTQRRTLLGKSGVPPGAHCEPCPGSHHVRATPDTDRRAAILYVDDHGSELDAFERLFSDSFDVHTASCGEEGLRALREHEIDIVLADQRMPGMSGIEFLTEVVRLHPDTARFIVTGCADAETVMAAINEGRVQHYVTKPWDPIEMRARLGSALEMVQMMRCNRRLVEELTTARDELQVRLEQTAVAEVQYRSEQRRFQSLFEGAPDAMVVIDESGAVNLVNEPFVELFGFPRDELIGRSITSLFPEEVWQRHVEVCRSYVEAPYHRRLGSDAELRCRRSNGELFSVEIAIAPLAGAGPPTFLATVRDISERVQSGAKLRQSEQTLRAVLDAMPLGVALTRPDGSVAYSNRRAQELTGHVVSGAVGVDLIPRNHGLVRAGTDLFYPPDRLPAWRALQGVSTYADDIEVLLADGARIPIEAWSSPVHDADGELVLAVTAISEITNRRHAELELRDLTTDLEQRVADRTTELEAAREAAEAANRLKTSFLANISHEIRTPLNAVLGYAQLLRREESLASEHRHRVQAIERAGEHLKSLIEDVLEMSRIESGRLTLSTDTVDLPRILNDVTELVRPQQESDEVRLDASIDPSVPRYVMADGPRLRQILINLLGNAFKFTRYGQVGLRARAYRDGDGQSQRLRITVSDTGPGIAEADVEHVFESFRQTDVGRTRGGTGLGLAISREYARAMGGELSVESVVGQGSTFTLDVPLLAAEASMAAPSPRLSIAELTDEYKNTRALVVDDNPVGRAVLADLLAKVGFDTYTASSGEDALVEFARRQPAVVLMDLCMPGLDGYDATRRLRELPGGDSAVVVAVSASALEEVRTDALAAGADEFISRPYRDDALLTTIGNLLGARYEYEGRATTTSIWPPPRQAFRVDPAAIRKLDAKLLANLREATAAADIERLEQLIAGIADDGLKRALLGLASSYEYDWLLRHLNPKTEQPPGRAEAALDASP